MNSLDKLEISLSLKITCRASRNIQVWTRNESESKRRNYLKERRPIEKNEIEAEDKKELLRQRNAMRKNRRWKGKQEHHEREKQNHSEGKGNERFDKETKEERIKKKQRKSDKENWREYIVT